MLEVAAPSWYKWTAPFAIASIEFSPAFGLMKIFSVVERKFIYARVNERGVGETDACGSGALALFTYLREINKVDDDAVVLYPGGELELSYEKEKLYLKGEVTYL